MQRSLYRIAILAVAFSAAVVGCAAESTPDPGPQIDPLNPQPLPPVITDDDDDGEVTRPGQSDGTSGSNSNGSSSGSSSGGSSSSGGPGSSGSNPSTADAGDQ
ncbi:MAG: hypothetical protein KIT84_44540 [Labilithrix sp.]|nr:hypothetical protein [Labilithrix sp.]MCW5818149.1 hypothetical protein [Labilithrix sp.]